MLKLLVVTNEIPFPPSHGGRVDVLRRLQALTRHGASIGMLITWCSDSELAQTHADERLREQVPLGHLEVVEISRSWQARWRRLAGLWRQSLYVVTRSVPADKVAQLDAKARQLGVQLVLADGLFAGPLAEALAARLGVPLVYRSHNIEHQYLRRQARLARGARSRLALWLASRGVEALERRLIHGARLVLDISRDDMAYWAGQGVRDIRWLPPYCPPLPPPGQSLPPHDVAFLGNLFMPNNVDGLRWFVQEVWRRVTEQRPGTTLLVAGSSPAPELAALCSQTPGVTLLANPANVSDVYHCARVLINPTRQGSGVNMKALEFLDSGKPVVSTSQGVKGLPAEHGALFHVADQPEAFAARVLALLDGPHPVAGTAPPSRLPACYRPEAAQTLVEWLRAAARSGAA